MRTYTLLGLGGGMCGLVGLYLGLWAGLIPLAGLVVALLLSHRARLNGDGGTLSATDIIASLLTLLFGLAATTGHVREALVGAGMTVLILSMRETLHGWLRALDQQDIRSIAQYAAISLVILPLLPDRPMGPFDALNPRMLWLVVVFVTGLSFTGYWASKLVGQTRGTLLTAALGATYSSTAVTLELARRLRAGAQDAASLNAGIAIATAVMPVRVMLICAFLLPGALRSFAIGIGAAILFAILYATASTWRADRHPAERTALAPPGNPIALWSALGFAALVAVLIVAARWSILHFEGAGMTEAVIGVTGFYDVDAAIIAASTLPQGAIAPMHMGLILSLPILANSLLKSVMVVAIAGWKQGRIAALPLFGSSLLILLGIVWLLRAT